MGPIGFIGSNMVFCVVGHNRIFNCNKMGHETKRIKKLEPVRITYKIDARILRRIIMDQKKYNRAVYLKNRIHELDCMERDLDKLTELYVGTSKTNEYGTKISADMRAVLLALCIRERERLEIEFEEL